MDLNMQKEGILPLSNVSRNPGSLKAQLLFCKVTAHETLSRKKKNKKIKEIGINWKLQLEAINCTVYLKNV